ncbi:MAG: pyruvoyl-dependent arginine decarboxylase [Bacteriovoracaceae bacterium]|nr:pyruvoyl-dependent arginine decarboxylase [Bacteriovoracaceae bacterium]
MVKDLLIGNRIPKNFFITMGTGQSDIAVHAGSYHLALKDAGIEAFNIMTYSSILPSIATCIDKPKGLVHGSVMESIMAVSNSVQGEIASAGLIFGWLYDKETGKKYGGLVCEHNGQYKEQILKDQLWASLDELYLNGFNDQYNLKDVEVFTQRFTPEKKYGTALVSLCFVNYLYPVIEQI